MNICEAINAAIIANTYHKKVQFKALPYLFKTTKPSRSLQLACNAEGKEVQKKNKYKLLCLKVTKRM